MPGIGATKVALVRVLGWGLTVGPAELAGADNACWQVADSSMVVSIAGDGGRTAYRWPW
jgi:hypothetical protein